MCDNNCGKCGGAAAHTGLTPATQAHGLRWAHRSVIDLAQKSASVSSLEIFALSELASELYEGEMPLGRCGCRS